MVIVCLLKYTPVLFCLFCFVFKFPHRSPVTTPSLCSLLTRCQLSRLQVVSHVQS